MSRKSSIHFKPVSNVRFAVSHSERTDLSEPAYLLPKEHQLDNVVVAGSLSENDIAALFEKERAGMTGQAKARGSSPFWEGVVVLDGVDAKKHSANLQQWKKEYEMTTGHKVLHMSVHLDEGYLDEKGKPQYNPHAHVIVNRMDGKNRIINLDRKQLAKVQDLTAKVLQMQRGSTLEERKGMRGRKHVPHREYRAQADESRVEVKQHVTQAVNKTKGENFQRTEAQIAEVKAKLEEQYKADRAALKASGEATQKAYQELKIAHQAALAELVATKEKVAALTEYTGKLEAATLAGAENRQVLEAKLEVQVAQFDKLKADAMAVITPLRTEVKTMKKQITELTQENAKLEADKAKFAAMATQYQAEKAAGTPAHLIVPGVAAKGAATPPGPLLHAGGETAVLPSEEGVGRASLHAPRRIETLKTPQEAPRHQDLGNPPAEPEKSLKQRLNDSWDAFVAWIKREGGVEDLVGPATRHEGPVVKLDDLHCVQKTGRSKFAIHRLADLDKMPELDDSKMAIKYQDWVGHVSGKQPAQYQSPGLGD